ncbi:MAG: hypothetical protein E6Q97_00580 [Desulfurellales bacterium]|nr:MAG: hypothetical protein E6Q97_00580 [Desulfurellales bacterium]
MAVNYWLNRQQTEVAQVKTFAITADSSGNTAVWTFTMTLDDGSTATVTYTEDGSPTTTEIATGLYNAWNASTHPAISRITATNPVAGTVVLTADTAGVPFSVALSDSDDGTHTETNTTANVGNNDYGTAGNWSLNAVPASTNDVVISAPASGGECTAIKYGLNQSAVDIATFRVTPDYNADIGRVEDGRVFYLRIDPDTVDYRSASNFAALDIGSANISPYIECNGFPSTGRHALYIKGSNIATLEVKKGNVGVAVQTGDTATVATILCAFLSNAQGDVQLKIGSGVTLTTLTQSGGQCDLGCAATTVSVSPDGVLTTSGTGAITTLNLNGTAYPNSTGTITTINLYAGVLDFRRDRSGRTVTTLNILPREQQGPTVYNTAAITFTNRPVMPTDVGTFRWTMA